MSVGDHQPVTHIERLEGADAAETVLPRPGFKIGLEACNATRDRLSIEKRKPRDTRADRWVKVRFWSTPERREESIDAVMGYRDVVNRAVADVAHEVGHSRTPALSQSDNIREVRFGQPEVAEIGRLECKNHRPIRDSPHFIKTTSPIRPMMQGQHCERCVKRPVWEWEGLGRGLHDLRRRGGALTDHAPGRLDCNNGTVDRLVSTGACPDIDHDLRVA